jgi:cyanophycin synthetase
LAAVAAARAYRLSVEKIVETLTGQACVELNSGRGALYRVGGGHVLVDYGHDPEAFKAVGIALRGLNGRAGRVTAVIWAPGDRDDDLIRQAGRAAARSFDCLIIKEDVDLRGRKSGEVSKLLYQSAAEAAPGIERRVVLDEQDALELAIREMREGEIAVIFYEKLDRITEVLERHSAVPVTSLDPRARV